VKKNGNEGFLTLYVEEDGKMKWLDGGKVKN
jgi:hypothetical protein